MRAGRIFIAGALQDGNTRCGEMTRRTVGDMTAARTAVALLLVVFATLAAGVIAMGTYSADRSLSIGTISLSVDSFHRGALDLYVPVVDWGVRFPVVRLPVRLKAEVRAVNRDAVTRLAEGETVDVKQVRDEARDAVASYIRVLLMVVLLAELAIGVLTAF